MNKIVNKYASLTSMILLFVISDVAFGASYRYGDVVSLTSLAYQEYFYEQYNYGESPDKDKVVGACLLKLDSAIEVDNNLIHNLQIIDANSRFKCKSVVGHRISVSGKLEEKETGHHHGDALIILINYRILR